MKKRLFAFVLLCGTLAYARDWTRYPAVVQMDTHTDIFAVGDPHSDAERLTSVLAAAKLIDGKGAWTGGPSVVVITGDVIGKGPSALRVFALIRRWQAESAARGGRVILTMGNHEAEFLAEPGAKKAAEFRDELAAAGLDPLRVAACEGDLGEFLCRLPIAARVNDWFFSHGGNTQGRTIAELTAAIQAGVDQKGFATPELIGKDSILEARLGAAGPDGLPWIYDGDPHADPRKLLALYAKNLGVHHIVQGHQPGKVEFLDGKERNKEDMFERWGLLFLTDTAMSRGIKDSKSIGGLLRISGNSAEAICADGDRKVLWDAKTDQPVNAMHCGR